LPTLLMYATDRRTKNKETPITTIVPLLQNTATTTDACTTRARRCQRNKPQSAWQPLYEANTTERKEYEAQREQTWAHNDQPPRRASSCAATGALSLQAVVRLPHPSRRPLCVYFSPNEQALHLPRCPSGRQTPYDRLPTALVAQGPVSAALSPPSWLPRPPPCQRPLCQGTSAEESPLLDDA